MHYTLNRRTILAGGAALAATAMLPKAGRSAALPAQITDGQVHIWDFNGEKAPSASGRREPLKAEELLSILDTNGVQRAVIVTPSWAPRGNAYSLESAIAHPDRLAVLGLMSMPAEDKKAEIEGWLEQAGMRGLRMFLSSEAGTKYLAEGGADWLWPVLAERGIPVAVHAGDSLDVLASAARNNPSLRLAVDAFGLGRNVEATQMSEKFEAVVTALADLPNVSIKTGAIPRDSGDAAPYPNAAALVRRAYDTFGAERIMYASDLTLLKGPYSDGLSFWTALDFLSDGDLVRILGQNMNDWLDWA